MAKKYQTGAKKSNPKFEVMGGKGVDVRLSLPWVEVWEQLQPLPFQLSRLTPRFLLPVASSVC